VGTAALALTLAVQVTQTLNWTVRQATEVETHLIAVERLKSYDELQPEPGYSPEQQTAEAPSGARSAARGEAHRASSMPIAQTLAAEAAFAGGTVGAAVQHYGSPDSQWLPAAAGTSRQPDCTERRHHVYAPYGQLELREVSLRYRNGLPDVLSGISATFDARAKVGVVGRTGSGKSSLVAALTRLVAPPLRRGQIMLDGVDISSVPLHTHRSAVSVIPQEPILFSGTVRHNLDPLDAHKDEALWSALQRVHLAHAVRSLDDQVAEDGANFSAGQRQLLCIARALLSRCSLVIIDEATSAVDAETDALIQRAVRSAFADATVITIAHRLNTVLDSDHIIVLDAGQLVEFGSPKELMARSRGRFREMVMASSYL